MKKFALSPGDEVAFIKFPTHFSSKFVSKENPSLQKFRLSYQTWGGDWAMRRVKEDGQCTSYTYIASTDQIVPWVVANRSMEDYL